MLELNGEVDYQGLYELRQRRDSGRKTLSRLSEELNRILPEAKAKAEMLKSLNAEYALTEREMKRNQSEIILLKEKCSSISTGFTRLHMEFVRGKEQLADLYNEKDILGERIAGLEKEIFEISVLMTTQEEEKQELLKEIAEKNEEKQRISDEISEALSETSLDREQIEQQIMELNESFMEHISGRNDIQTRLTERESSIEGLKEGVEELERQVESIEEIKRLLNDRHSTKEAIDKIRVVLETVNSKLDGLSEELEGKQEQFDTLSKTNDDLNSEVQSLEEEVAEYVEAATRKDRAQEENDSALEGKERALEGLMGLFTNKTKLELSLSMMEEKIKAVAELAEPAES